jgi:hypothetical protein
MDEGGRKCVVVGEGRLKVEIGWPQFIIPSSQILKIKVRGAALYQSSVIRIDGILSFQMSR